MSFLTIGVSTCFICGRPIEARIEAAQLEYASPEDVGEVARQGRAWVHRPCWQAWPTRRAWCASTCRLMAAAPGVTRARSVMVRPAGAGLLLTDAGAPISIALPRDQLVPVCNALRSPQPTTVSFDHVAWHFAPLASAIRLTAAQGGEPLLDLVIEDPDAWCDALAAQL
jgi:hypothetical protein